MTPRCCRTLGGLAALMVRVRDWDMLGGPGKQLRDRSRQPPDDRALHAALQRSTAAEPAPAVAPAITAPDRVCPKP